MAGRTKLLPNRLRPAGTSGLLKCETSNQRTSCHEDAKPEVENFGLGSRTIAPVQAIIMTDGISTSALALRRAVRRREVSPVELMRSTLSQVERVEPFLNSFVTLLPERAMASARRAEAMLLSGDPLPPLLGLPISVKDVLAVKGVRVTFGSKLAADQIARIDASGVERIEKAGACIIGKTTTSEFGSKAVGDSPLTGITRNPWNLAKTPGGSSSGAAASVAAGVTPFALGTDGGGSVRIPCAFTGLFGVKPSFGRVPFYPRSATPTLAHVGPIARTVRDAALLLGVLAGRDPRDPSSLEGPVPDFLNACECPAIGLRVAVCITLGYAEPDPEVCTLVQAAAAVFEELGCDVVEVDRVMNEDPVRIWAAEFYGPLGAALDRKYESRMEMLDPALAALLGNERNRNAGDYHAQVLRRYELRESMQLLFERFDLLLTPTLPVAAFDVGLNSPPEKAECDPVGWAKYTYPFNLIGYPACSIPAGFTRKGLPVGFQLVARMNGECDIFRAAASYEAARPWAGHRPSIGGIPQKSNPSLTPKLET